MAQYGNMIDLKSWKQVGLNHRLPFNRITLEEEFEEETPQVNTRKSSATVHISNLDFGVTEKHLRVIPLLVSMHSNSKIK